MEKFGIDAKQLKKYALIALAYLIISSIFFYPMVLDIAAKVPGSGGDVYQGMWGLWWVPYALFTLHATPYFTSYVFYPVGANLATQTFSPIAGIVSAVFQQVSLAFAYNIIFLLGFVLSGLFAYLLAHHITKNDTASFLAGFIYAFGPIHSIQAFGHLQFTNIEFIPLFLLFFLKMTEERKMKHAICAAASFVLLTFMGDIEQGLMTVLLVFFVLAYMIIEKTHRNKILNKKFAYLFIEMLAAILLLGSPFFIGILSGLNNAVLSSVNSQASLQYNELYSPDLFSFLIPSQQNGLLSFISKSFASINAPAVAERTVYAGYTVLLLAALAVVSEYKQMFRKIGVFLVPLILFALLAIGPYLQIGGTVTGIPGVYLLYDLVPFFNVLREPGRFDIMIQLMLSVLAAVGFMELENKHANAELKKYLPVIFIALLIMEYNTLPIGQSMLSSMYSNATIPKAYAEIGALQGNFTMLLLPALPNYASNTPALYPGLALFYQTAFRKPLVGGYTTRYNASQIFSLVNVPLVASAQYLQNGEGLVYGSPIAVNYTNSTVFLLGAYNVGFVSVIRQAYNITELQQITSYLTSMLGDPVYQSNDTIVFSTLNIVNQAGRAFAAYTPVLFGDSASIWQPGWVICGESVTCKASYSDKWFAANPAYINMYSPNYTRINITMQAFAPVGFQKEYIYFNNQPASILNLTPSVQNFTLKVGLNPGINQLVLLSTTNSTSVYSNVGIVNITFNR